LAYPPDSGQQRKTVACVVAVTTTAGGCTPACLRDPAATQSRLRFLPRGEK